MDMKRKSDTLNYQVAPPSCRRRHEDHVDEWRDWASLPRDVLCIVLGRLRQTDILRGAELVCSPWRRIALEEPQLWLHIDLSDGIMWPCRHQKPPAGWKAMAHVAVDRSARRAPLLKKLYVGGWPYIRDTKLIKEIIKKLPLLEHLTLGGGVFQEELLVALLDHCPRLELLDASFCRPMFRVWQEPIARRIRSNTIKKLQLPYEVLS
ncbi:hypothetical protein ACQ4PT_012070 [Festuca glaucescens]